MRSAVRHLKKRLILYSQPSNRNVSVPAACNLGRPEFHSLAEGHRISTIEWQGRSHYLKIGLTALTGDP